MHTAEVSASTSGDSTEQAFDIVIVGGGLVGATLALALSRYAYWRVALIEKTAFDFDALDQVMHPSFDARNTALSNGTCELFDQLGLWATLKPQASAICHIDVSDQGGFGHVTIDAEQERVAALGYVVENRFIGQALLGCLRTAERVTFFSPAEFSRPKAVAGGFTGLITHDNQTVPVRTRLLVVADGADSPSCEQLGIGVTRNAYGQQGIVTALASDRAHNGWAWERFTPQGPLAILPQTEGRLGLTWCVDNADAERLLHLSDIAFMQALQQVAGNGPGTFQRVGRRYAYPLRLVLAEEQVRPHLVVLGNAAHGLHPVAGQGLNMALRDVVVLVRVLVDAARRELPLGQFHVLQDYLTQRSPDQFSTIQFSDKLTRLFSNNTTPLRLLRNTGLALFDVLPGAKHTLARYAMGRAVAMQLP